MMSNNHFGLDTPAEQYHKHLAHSQSTKESVELENINRFFDKCKEQKVHQIALEEKELKKTLKKLEREKLENRRKGSAVDQINIEDARAEEKKRKGIIVKLQPGKIDFERMSPPSSHDVAVRMLFDKKGQVKKKKTKKKIDQLLGPDTLETSYSHDEASLTLPTLSDEESSRRRHSLSGSEDHSIEHDQRYHKPGPLKSSKPKKRSKKTIATAQASLSPPVVHIPVPPKPDIVVLSAEQNATALASHAGPLDELPQSSSDSLKRSFPPKIPHRAWAGFSDSIDEETDQITAGNSSKLPQIPFKSNLVENKTKHVEQEDHIGHSDRHSARKQRRASLDYRDLDFLQGPRSFTPTANVLPRRASIGGPHDVPKHNSSHEEPSKKGSKTKKLDIYMLDHYYALLSDTQKSLKEEDPSFALPRDSSKHLPLCTLKRSQRRKAMALEVLLKQLPGYKHTEIEPKDILNCRYLRLSRNNVEQLEDMCRQEGKEPGLHAHMTQQEVEDYFELLDHPDNSDTDSEIELVCAGHYSPSSHMHRH